MANSLLDFVMSLVRDPDAAAAYADNPAQAIADAHLTDVTSVDVNNLIPVVSESLSMAVPSMSSVSSQGDDGLDDGGGNVWASGAATAAFDAFDDHVPAAVVDDVHSVTTELVNDPDTGLPSGLDGLGDAGVPGVAAVDDPSLQFDGPLIDDLPVHETPVDDDWSHSVSNYQQDDHHLDTDSSGFDVFE
jgi:hypothetical protein